MLFSASLISPYTQLSIDCWFQFIPIGVSLYGAV